MGDRKENWKSGRLEMSANGRFVRRMKRRTEGWNNRGMEERRSKDRDRWRGGVQNNNKRGLYGEGMKR